MGTKKDKISTPMPPKQRERVKMKNIRLIPMPNKQGWHVIKNARVLRKRKGWHLCLVKNDKGILRKIKGWHLCHINKGDMSTNINGYYEKEKFDTYAPWERVTCQQR